MKKGFCILIAVCLLLFFTACGEDAPAATNPTTTTTTESTTTTTLPQEENGDALCFTGRVLEIAEQDMAVLMACVGTCPLGDRVWVQLGRYPDLVTQMQVGATYVVTYEDMVMPSLPPRITAVTVTPLDEGSAAPGTTTTTVATTTTTTEAPTTVAPATTTAPTVTTTTLVSTSLPKPLGTLHAAQVKKLQEVILAMDPEAADQYTAADIQLTYYGTYQECIVVSIDAPFLPQSGGEWTESIGGYTFYEVGDFDLYVWHAGEFFMLRDVYQNGWITDRDLRDIAYYWNKE